MQFTIEQLRTFKGAPLSILMAMVLARQPVSAQWLETVTGYSDKPIMSGLRLLKELGYITRNHRYNWQFADGIMQLPLMYPIEPYGERPEPVLAGEDGESFQHSSAGPSAELGGASETETDGPGEIPSRKNSESPIVVSLLINPDIDYFNKLTRAPESEKFRVKLDLLEYYGINDPKRSKIAKNPKLSIRSLVYHCEECVPAGNTGLAIFRMEKVWRAPASWKAPWDISASSMSEVLDEDVVDVIEAVDTQALLGKLGELGADWPGMMGKLQGLLQKVEFDTWCRNMQVVNVSTETVTVKVANDFVANWIREHVVTFMQDQLGLDVEVIS